MPSSSRRRFFSIVLVFVLAIIALAFFSQQAFVKSKREGPQGVGSGTRSIATADFDGDAAPDIVVGSTADDGTGIIDLRRGNPDAFAPTDDSVFARMQKGYDPDALLEGVRTFSVPARVDFIATGNFDNDGQKDVVTAAEGDGRIFLLKGDGKSGFAPAKEIVLKDAVTALAAGQFGAADGLEDLVVGTTGKLLVFDGAGGGISTSPMEILVPGEVRTVRLGEMDGDPFVDIVAATDSEIYILHGWGRKNAVSAESQLERVASDVGVREMIVGHFVWDRDARLEIAAVSGDGIVKVLGQGSLRTQPYSDKEKADRARLRLRQTGDRNVDVETVRSWSVQDRRGWSSVRTVDASSLMSGKAGGSLIATTNLFYRETQDILVAGEQKVTILRQVTEDVAAPRLAADSAFGTSGDMAAFSVSDSKGAVSAVLQLPQKVNGVRNLLVLREKTAEPETVSIAPTNITVDRTDDPSGASLPAASVCSGAANDCSVRGAVQFANLPANSPATINLGTNTYTLNTNGAGGCVIEPAATGNTIGDLESNLSTTFIGTGSATTIIRQLGTGNVTYPGDRVLCLNVPLAANIVHSFSGLTLTGGRDKSGIGGGAFIGGDLDNSVTLTSVRVSNNQMTGNSVPGGGGGLVVTGGDLIITNSTIGGPNAPGANRNDLTLGNESTTNSGAGIGFTPSSPGHAGGTGDLTVTGTTFDHNVCFGASGGGGADLYTFAFGAPGGIGSGTTSFATSTFSTNSSMNSVAGAIALESIGSTVATTAFTNNHALTSGGAIYLGGGTGLTLNGTAPTITFSGNTANSGSAIGVNVGIDQNPVTNVRTINPTGGVQLQGTNTIFTGQSVFLGFSGAWTNQAGSSVTFDNLQQDSGGNACGGCANGLMAAFKANNTTTNITGNWTINGGTFVGDSGTVNVAGNFTFNQAAGHGAVTAGTSTVNFNGTGAQSISNNTTFTFFNLTDSNITQPLTLNNSFNVNGTLNVNGANAVLAPVAASVIGGTGTLTGNGTARVTRTAATAGFLNQYAMTNKTLTNLLVDYVGAAAQVLSSTTYGPLRINNVSGVASAAGTATVNGLLTLQNGTLNVGTSTLIINNGPTVVMGGLASAATGTINYNSGSGGQPVLAANYGNLIFSNQNKVLASSGTIGIAGTFTPGTAIGHTITNSTINFNGTGAQTIPAFSYNNLTISGAHGANNVTLVNGGTIGIAGAFSPTATFAGGAYVITGNTVDYNGSGPQTIAAFNYNNLTSSNIGTRTLANAGTIGVAGVFTLGTNTYTITGSTINFNGTGAQSVPAFNYNNLSISGAHGPNNVTLPNGGTIGVAGAFSPTATFTSGSYVIAGNTMDFNGSGTQTIPAFNYNNLTSSNTGARTLANAGTIGIFGNFTPGTNTYTITGSTINFNGTGAQTIPAFNYNNLTSSSTGARTLANTGTVGIAGVFTLGGNTYTTTGSTVNYNGAAQSIVVLAYNNLSTAGSGIKSLTGATTVGGALTIGAGTTLDVTAGNFALNVAGNWTNNGAFTAQGGTVTLNGSSQQTVGGSSATNFFNLILNNANGALLSQNVTVNGLLTLTAGVLNIGTNTFTMNNGTTVTGGSLNGSAGTTVYGQGAAGQVVLAGNYNNLTFSNSNKILPNGGTIGISGTFTPGTAVGHTITNSTIDFNGSGAQTIPAFNYFNLTSSNTGTRTLAPSGTIGIANVFTPGANAYTVTGSTINFNGTVAQTIPAFNYNNLTSSNTGARTLASSGTVGVAGAFTPGTNVYTITGSTVDFNGTGAQTIPAFNYNNLTSSSSGARTLANSGIIRVASIFTPGTNAYTVTGSTVEYNGSSAQTQPATVFTYHNLTINNAAGVTLSANANVNQDLTLNNGNVITGTPNAIIVGGTGNVVRVSGHVVGNLEKVFTGPTTFTYQVGTTGYTPVIAVVTAGAGQLRVRANDGVPVVAPIPIDPAKTLQRYFTLTGSGITSNLSFTYLDTDVPATTSESLWNVIRVTGNTVIRYPPGPDIIFNTGANIFTVNGLTTYSHWTAGEPLAPTAANAMVSGRVLDADGRGVAGALVSMQGQTGNTVWAVTNPFGYYRFASIATGQNYLIAPRHKRFTFEPRSISVNDDVTGVDFTPSP